MYDNSKSTYVKESSVLESVEKVTYKERDIVEEMNVLFEFLTKGIDMEDILYLKKSYEILLADDSQSYWLNDTHWVDHCPTDVPYTPPKKKARKHGYQHEELQV